MGVDVGCNGLLHSRPARTNRLSGQYVLKSSYEVSLTGINFSHTVTPSSPGDPAGLVICKKRRA